MRGTIVSENEGRVELLDLGGTIRIFHRKGGFYLGENGRLYTKVATRYNGRNACRDRRVEFVSLGRAASADIQECRLEKDIRTVKDAIIADHLTHLRQTKRMSGTVIAQRYGVSPTYISRLLQDYKIPDRPARGYRARLQRVREALLLNPFRANKWIADELESSQRTVARTRRELEEEGRIPKVQEVLGRDGKWYPRQRG